MILTILLPILILILLQPTPILLGWRGITGSTRLNWHSDSCHQQPARPGVVHARRHLPTICLQHTQRRTFRAPVITFQHGDARRGVRSPESKSRESFSCLCFERSRNKTGDNPAPRCQRGYYFCSVVLPLERTASTSESGPSLPAKWVCRRQQSDSSALLPLCRTTSTSENFYFVVVGSCLTAAHGTIYRVSSPPLMHLSLFLDRAYDRRCF